MKLKLVQPIAKNAGANFKTPSIYFSKTGIISFSRKTIELLHLYDGCRVEFFQDEASPKDWYISLSTTQSGYHGRQNKTYFGFSSRALVNLVRSSLSRGIEEKLRFRIAFEPVQYNDRILYAIITSVPL